MNNDPDSLPELCECGHELEDHNVVDSWCTAWTGTLANPKLCTCQGYVPRDDYWEDERRADAAIERWENSR